MRKNKKDLKDIQKNVEDKSERKTEQYNKFEGSEEEFDLY